MDNYSCPAIRIGIASFSKFFPRQRSLAMGEATMVGLVLSLCALRVAAHHTAVACGAFGCRGLASALPSRICLDMTILSITCQTHDSENTFNAKRGPTWGVRRGQRTRSRAATGGVRKRGQPAACHLPPSPIFDLPRPIFDPPSPIFDPPSPIFDPPSPIFNPPSPIFNPSSTHPAPSSTHPAPSSSHPAPSSTHPAPSSTHPAPSSTHPAPS
jgi:hypothetical protein